MSILTSRGKTMFRQRIEIIPNKTHKYETLGKHAGGGKTYTTPMIEISTFMVDASFAMSNENVKTNVIHDVYTIEDEFNW